MKEIKEIVINILAGLLVGALYFFSIRFDFLYAWTSYIPSGPLRFLCDLLPPVVVSIIVACILGKNRIDRIENALMISVISIISFFCILAILFTNAMYNFDR